MFIYLFLFSFISILYFKSPYKWSGKSFWFFVLSVVLVAGLRDMIGGFDVYIYGETFEMPTPALFLYPAFEWGYKFYYVFLKFFSTDRAWMFFVSSILVLGGHALIIKKLSPILYFSLFLYFAKFFLMSFVYIRQGIAMIIIWQAVVYLIDKQHWKVALLLVLAFFFHKSSLICAPFFLVAHFRLNSIQLALLSIVVFIVSVSPIGQSLISLIAEADDGKIAKYAAKSGGVNVFYLLETALLVMLALLFRKKFKGSRKELIIFNGFVFYLLMIMVSLTNATFVRLAWYYFIFVTLALPYMYVYIKDKSMKLGFKSATYIYFALIFFRLLIVYDSGDFMPYKSIFQDFDRNGDWEFMEYRQNYNRE